MQSRASSDNGQMTKDRLTLSLPSTSANSVSCFILDREHRSGVDSADKLTSRRIISDRDAE